MKTQNLKLSLLLLVLMTSVGHSFSQTCSDPIKHAWQNIPKIQYSASSNQYISLGTGSLQQYFNMENFTIDFMVKIDDVNTDITRIIFSADNSTQTNNPYFYLGVKKVGSVNNLVITDNQTTIALSANKWYHVSIVFTTNNAVCYVNNGTSTSSVTYARTAVIRSGIGTSTPFNIGHSNYLISTWIGLTNNFNNLGGRVSGFRVWNKALSTTELNYVRNRTFKMANTFNSTYFGLDGNLKVNLLTDHAATHGYYDQKNVLNSISQSNFSTSTSYSDAVPSLPINFHDLSVDAPSLTTVGLSWSAGSDSSTYKVYRKLKNASDNTYALICTRNTTSFSDNTFNFGDVDFTYKVKVCFNNSTDPLSSGSTTYYGEDIIIDGSLAKFPAITGLTASTNLCDGRVKLQWNRASCSAGNSSSYTLQYKVDGGPWQTVSNDIASAGSPVVYYHDVPLADYGKEIQYRVDANGDNQNNFSSIVIGKANEICNAITSIVVASIENNNIRIDWNFAQGTHPAETFNIYRKKDTEADYTLLSSGIEVSQTHFTDHTAAMCKTYTYKISAVNSCGESNLSLASNSIYLTQEFDNVFATNGSFDASKGYFNNKVLLEWTSNPTNSGDIISYDIFRKKQSQSYSWLNSIENSNATSYEDLTAEANVIYEYRLRAVGECGGSPAYSDTATAVGFRVKTGIVSGKVTYSGGNAVPDVPILIASETAVTATSGNFENPLVCATSESFFDDSLCYKPLTVDMWVKSTNVNDDNQIFFSILNGVFYLEFNHMVPTLILNQKSLAFDASNNTNIAVISGDTVLSQNVWYHLSVNIDNITGTLKMYLNGILIGSHTIDIADTWVDNVNCDLNINQPNIIVGNGLPLSNLYNFQGQIDEIRIWQKSRTAAEIKNDYQLLLSGGETSLIGYYRLDENFGTSFYDLSKKNGVFNKNDFEFSLPENYTNCWSTATPAYSQLHAGGVTNINGNYTITGIKYSGSGDIFTVTPVYGVHEFNPNNASLYIGDGNPVQNNVNFTDQSSFTFTGTIYFSGTNVPVEGAKVYIDNVQQFDGGGIPIVTNQYGQISISVPIGMHYISVKKDSHVFENNGQWPHPTESEPYKKFNFADNVNNITFFDSTRVIVAGRFVGGDREGNKNIGMGLSNANIGDGEIVLSNEQGYQINNGQSTQTINTDFAHGEYEVSLLPIVYKIDSVHNSHYAINELDLGFLDLTTIPALTTVTDTTYSTVINGSDTTIITNTNSYSYHFKRNFIHYEEPTITLFGTDNEEFNGESAYYLYNSVGVVTDTIDLMTNSPFRFPVFIMGNNYDMKVFVSSIYRKYSELGVVIGVDTVPVSNANITIVNNLEINETTHNLSTNETGIAIGYSSFKVGLPNMNQNEPELTSYTKTMTITGTAGNFSFAWNGGNVYRAYVLGGVDAGGVNFITYGPQITQFILRDPPGNLSYTSLEQGSEYSASRSFNFSTGGASDYDNDLLTGVKFEIGGGLAGPVFSSDVQSDFNGGLTTSYSKSDSGEFIETYSFNQTFSTSASPDAVGSMADVYIGRSLNLFFTETNNLKIYPRTFFNSSGNEHLDDTELANSASDYLIGKRPGYAVTDDPSSTSFIYSQDHILNTLLPTYKNLIYMLLTTAQYTSKILPTHVYYGLNNDAEVWADTIAMTGDTLPSYVFNGGPEEVDSVAFLNQQIGIWLHTVALNEAAKTAPTLSHVDNISFDGNVGPYTEQISTSTTSVSNKDYSFKFQVFGGSTDGFNINGTGLLTYSQTYMNWDRELSQSTTDQKTMKWKYVIDDSNQGDYFSVDVLSSTEGVWSGDESSFINSDNYDNIESTCPLWRSGVAFVVGVGLGKLINPLAGQIFNMANTLQIASAYMGKLKTFSNEIDDSSVYFGLQGASPIFRIMGGQSRCPYEGEEYTAFFIDSLSLEPILMSPGTQNHEAPKIAIEPAIRINVPENGQAVFELQLMNESPTGANITYELMLDEASNPHGAIIKVDGLSPNRPFFIPAGQTIVKTLTVERGASDNMDFVDLKLILHSACQYNPESHNANIADTVSFSAHFIPTCTEVNFANVTNNWVVNVYNNNIMPITVSGYDINQSTFEKIYFQYQQPGSTPSTAMTLYNDTINTDWASFTGAKIYINNMSQVSFNWNTAALNDGSYTLILTTLCSDGSIYVADHLAGIIDRITPRAFGTPEPADGILSFGEDISVLFNEPINVGELNNFGQYGSASYISVRGMLNGTDLIDSPRLLHDASVHFDGVSNYLKVDNLNLDHSNFSFEFWAKRDGLGSGNLINIGSPAQGGLWMGFDETDHFTIRVDGQTMTSEETYIALDEWAFYSVSYNRGDESNDPYFTLLILSDASGAPQVQNVNIYSSLENTMYVGYCPSDASGFYGNIHELRIWNYERNPVEIASQKGQILNGYEEGLYSLWPLTECRGTIAKDIAFGRDAIVNATWNVSRDGKALNLDGTNCLPVPAGSMVFTHQSDFTLEFWYKTPAPTADVTMFSNGHMENDFNIEAWTITANSSQQIVISNNGTDVTVNAQNFLDNNWHHFAMSINRIGYLNVYLDGNLVKTSPVINFKGFGASKFVAGARWYNLSMIDYYDQFMTGAIDEIRIWNSSRSQSQIQRYMNHTLKGDEMGLKAYFPFEDVTIEDPSISNENSGNFTMDTIGVAGDTLLLPQFFTSETPNMKLQRPEILIPHNIVISNDGVIISTNVDPAEIENQILDISIKNVKDTHNNVMASVLSWSAFIDKNQVVWDMQELDFIKFVEDETTLTVNIRNKGGLNENFNITNIPSWMVVSPSSGTLSPLEVKQIQITINPELNIGSYQRDLNLVASMGYNERLELNIKVNGHAPNWTVVPENYTNTANIIGQLSIGNILSTDTEDIVACFVGNVCRGVTNIQHFTEADMFLCFMSVYSNTNGESVTFKVYDASTGEIYNNVSPEIVFQSNTLYGTVNNPLPINATNYVEQNINLLPGWNWVSFNVYSELFNNLNTSINNLTSHFGSLIKSQTSFSTVRMNDGWFGSLNSLDVKSSYKIHVKTAHTLNISGYRVVADTIEIPIVSGWNWIGYPLSSQKTLLQALSSLNPAENDIIKSQHQFAVYSELLGWVGSLTYLQPGKGYILKSSSGGTLHYMSEVQNKAYNNQDESITDLPNTEQNMTIIATAATENPELYTVSAYDENGLCGKANASTLSDGSVRFFITINSSSPNTVRFALESLHGSLNAKEVIDFSTNEMIGNLNQPFILSFDNPELLPLTFADVYPNPFKEQIKINIWAKSDQEIRLYLYNSIGTEISAISKDLNKGKHEFELIELIMPDKSIASGVYMLKVQINGTEELIKIVKQ